MRIALAIALLAASAPAFADDKKEPPPDPNAERAGEEANLETIEHRRGFWAYAGIGPSITFEIGGETGPGGGGAVMVGAVMRPSLVALFALTANAQQHEVMNKPYVNDYTTIQAGVQWWLKGSIYFRFAGGFGSYRCKQCKNPDEETNPIPVDYQRRGLTGTFAAGFELVRFKGLVWGFDMSFIGTATADGVPVSLGLQSFLSLD